MASFLRSLVATPRRPHTETGLDLCYVHESNPCLIVMSVPASSYPKKAYRNPLSEIVSYLDSTHGDRWSVWEFRAEGTGYDDAEMHNRIYHAPWPDHQPPPFELVPNVLATMRDHLKGGDKEREGGERVCVLHCKAGKGRSGTMACAYLITEEGWEPKDALKRFTEVRMRPGFGEGVSIKSQLRWIGYFEKWAKELDKIYVDSEIEIVEVRIWGLRENTKILVDGYKEKGKLIHTYHTFTQDEIGDMPEDTPGYLSADFPQRKRSSRLSLRSSRSKRSTPSSTQSSSSNLASATTPSTSDSVSTSTTAPTETTTPDSTPSTLVTSPTSTPTLEQSYPNVVCRPTHPLILPNSDACISFSSSTSLPFSLSLMTSIAYFWFNAYFHPTGSLSLTWDELDGLKGTYRKGFRTLDRVEVVFRRVPGHERVVKEAEMGRSSWEEMPGKAVEGREQGVGEKGGWVRTRREMEEQGLLGEHNEEEYFNAQSEVKTGEAKTEERKAEEPKMEKKKDESEKEQPQQAKPVPETSS